MKHENGREGNIYFTDTGISPEEGFVVWLDMMGASSIMKRSLKMSMNFIARIHIAALVCNKDLSSNLTLYPVMDGIYIFSNNERTIKQFLKCFYNKIYEYFSYLDKSNDKKFLIRSSIAYGKVYQGININGKHSDVLSEKDCYKQSLLIGMPMIQAYETEKLAPPFGIYVHESARFAGDFPYTWFRWFERRKSKSIGKEIISYFNWCKKRPHMIEYPEIKINEHEKIVKEYFELD